MKQSAAVFRTTCRVDDQPLAGSQLLSGIPDDSSACLLRVRLADANPFKHARQSLKPLRHSTFDSQHIDCKRGMRVDL